MSSIKKVRGTSGITSRRGTNPVVRPSTTGSSSRGGSVTPAQKNDIDARYDEMLQNNAGSNEFLSLLSSLGIEQEKGLTGSQRDDWNKQLLDTQLNYQLELEKRGYNEKMRDEQRIYDSPTNMLARLMGAGISRDAAIQLLSGAGGSQPIQTEGAVAGAGLSASESARNGLESKLGIANAVFNGVSAFSSLVGLGFSIPQALYQTQVLKGQAFLSNKDIKAIQSTDQAFAILNSIGAGADAFGSASAAISSIQDAANNGNSQAAAFIQEGGIDAIRGNANLASQRFKSLGSSEKGYEYESGRYIREMKKLEAETTLANVNVKLVAQEILNSQETYQKIIAETDFIDKQSDLIDAQAKVYEKQAELLDKQSKHEDAKILLTKAQELRQTLENNPIQALQTATADRLEYANGEQRVVSRTGLEWMTFDALDHLISDAQLASKTTNPEYIKACYMRMFSDANTLAMANALEALKLKSGMEFFTKYSEQAQLYTALEKCGVYEYLNAIRNGVYDYKAGATLFGLGFGVDKTGNTTEEFFRNLP